MAQPVEIFGAVKGMTRDFGVDSLPDGFLWDLVDAVPNRKGARVEQRGSWSYFGAPYPNPILGGAHVRFIKGTKLIVDSGAPGTPGSGVFWDVNLSTGAATNIGQGHSSMIQNGVMLRDRLYFFHGATPDATGPEATGYVPRAVTWDGVAAPAITVVSTAPKARVGIAYRDKLVVGGDPANPSQVYFSQNEGDGGPLAAWDVNSHVGTTQQVTGLAGMSSQILVFHPGMIERIRGQRPPAGTDEGDMYVETLTDQVGCTAPQTIVPWRENVLFADEHGVFLTDGATVRNLVELGGIGDLWRVLYGARAATQPISCGVFLDYLLVTVVVIDASAEYGVRSYTLVCDLNERTWMRFTNFPATCYIPSTVEQEESYVGHRIAQRLMKVSTMFQDALPIPTPPPDYADGDGRPVLMSLTTGFKRLAKEEGMQRIRNAFVSYQSESEVRAEEPSAVKLEYCLTPPRPEGLQIAGDVADWIQAGYLPDVGVYSRKKLPLGKRGYGVMVRLSAVRPTRTTRFFSIGIERTSQDRAKVTT